ncbi:MAG: serine/threonine protein kinase [Myxococcales bacterium]|nr:serine/threonine protein kinase [Myxococcales bacterium]
MTLIRRGNRVTPAGARAGRKLAAIRPAPVGEVAPAVQMFVLAGRYRLLERVGEGGMGVVWRAQDLDLDEVVAVKFLREDLASDPRLVAAFRREIKLGRRVTHRNVARVFEFGHTDELYFLTMEFIVGESLHAHLYRCGPRPALWVLELAAGLCRGLAAALAVGVVHGDIKPGNILMSPGRGAVITDFGIARALSEPLAREECLGGTPHYMAPEQALYGQLIPASDVYSVGLVLFEALAGRSPWPTHDPRALLELKAAGHEPALGSLAPQLRPEWLALLTACLRAEPGDRPRDVRALLLRLAALRGVR